MILNDSVTLVIPLLTTVTVKLNMPAAVGVPEMMPVDELSVKPAGSAPLAIVQVE